MTRIMGLDYGSKTVGVAISDGLLLTAQPKETIFRKNENKLRQTLARLETLIIENQVGSIVLGLPKHMNDDIGERALATLDFKSKLEKRTGLPIILWDERLTTWEAKNTLLESKVPPAEHKKYIDQIAAVFILQGYLDQKVNIQKTMEDTL